VGLLLIANGCFSSRQQRSYAFSEGEPTPIEGTRVMGLIDIYRRTLELTEIEERLQALENA